MRLGWKVFIPLTILWLCLLGFIIVLKVPLTDFGLWTVAAAAVFAAINMVLARTA
jgi:hypothetical protein